MSPAADWSIVARAFDGVAFRTAPVVVDVDEEIVQLYVAEAVPPGPVAVAAKVCAPTESELREVGVVQAEAAPLSTWQDTDVVLSADQANVAVVDVVEVEGV